MRLDKLELKGDTRGTLVEFLKLPQDGQVNCVIIYPDELRGNHYHTRKTEKFLLVAGTAIISSKDRDTNNVMRVQVNGTQPMCVTIPPNHTHNIEALNKGAVVLVWIDEVFNPDDPDTIMEEL